MGTGGGVPTQPIYYPPEVTHPILPPKYPAHPIVVPPEGPGSPGEPIPPGTVGEGTPIFAVIPDVGIVGPIYFRLPVKPPTHPGPKQ
jgi:hypothetical protein